MGALGGAPRESLDGTPTSGKARPGARRGVVEIVLGTVVGQGVIVAGAPVLSRLYAPADFALLQLFTGVVAIGAVLASMRLELAIPLAQDLRETRAVVRVGLLSSVVIAGVLGIAGYATSPWWARGETLRGLRAMWWLVPLTIAVLAMFQLVSAVLIRAERYRDLAGRNAAQGLGTAAAQLSFGFAGVRPLGLLLGLGIGRILGLVSVVGRQPLFGGPKRDSERPGTERPGTERPGTERPDDERLTTADLRAALHRFRRFPAVTTWSALLNSSAQWAPAFVFPATFGATPAGWLAFTMRLLTLPATVVGQSVAQVFLGRGAAAQRADSGQLPRLTWLAVRRLFVVGVGPALLLAVAGPWAFGWVFGSTWEQSGVYARILAAAFLLQFVASPIGNVFNLAGRQGVALVWDACRLVLVIAVPTLVWALGGSDVLGVTAYSGVLVFSYAGVLGLAWWVLRRA
ncbi:lipopolysaccharide biosynthesis protein [Actinopolymorpha sp. B9G3]|uniref:lipopolysaccharide biosynthesis protein n=1 Tax=Actinopolymorpha sp. B9G3 TaxID=3158970 RepID=UPI0032D8E50F